MELIKKLYYANDLKGEILVRPLKFYHHYLTSEGVNLALRILLIATAILAYPFFSLLATLGLAAKGMELLLYPDSIQRHNQNQILSLTKVRTSILYEENYDQKEQDETMAIQETVLMTRENANLQFDEIMGKIKNYTKLFKKVHLSTKREREFIRIDLCTREPVYFKTPLQRSWWLAVLD